MLNKQRLNECYSHVLQIDSAVIQCALENRHPKGYQIPPEKIKSYLHSEEVFRCPSGGRYTISGAGERIFCSYHGRMDEARVFGKKGACLRYLQTINILVQRATEEGKYQPGHILPKEELLQYYVSLDSDLPVCANGGKYEIPRVGGHPTCSFHGDLLLKEGVVVP